MILLKAENFNYKNKKIREVSRIFLCLKDIYFNT